MSPWKGKISWAIFRSGFVDIPPAPADEDTAQSACGPLGYKIKKPDKEYKKAKNVYPPASCDEGNVTLLSGNNALEFSGGAETPKWKFRKFVTRNVQL